MKRFVQFLIAIFVFILVGVTIYFCINENKENTDLQPPKNYQADENEIKDEKILNKNLKEIDDIRKKTLEAEDTREIRTFLQSGIFDDEIDEYIDFFGLEGVAATVHTVSVPEGISITIIPDVDFLKNQEFLYNGKGDLLLYSSISNTIEGVIHYYFSEGILLKIIDYYEEGITHSFENEKDILLKASTVYKMFAK